MRGAGDRRRPLHGYGGLTRSAQGHGGAGAAYHSGLDAAAGISAGTVVDPKVHGAAGWPFATAAQQ
ncbi:hypothetical protein HDC93_001761 [Streptomyces sp. AK010]|nr:hypothetical protein [Streptomyces sp. AK010]